MDADELRALQAPIKSRYREHPESAVITLKADGSLTDGIACSVSTGKALVTAGLHPGSGGTGALACSGDMLLQALVACAGVTIAAVATALGIEIRSGHLEAEGDLDFRGTLGVDKTAPVGFSAIRLAVRIDSDAPPRGDRQAPGSVGTLLRGVPDPGARGARPYLPPALAGGPAPLVRARPRVR